MTRRRPGIVALGLLMLGASLPASAIAQSPTTGHAGPIGPGRPDNNMFLPGPDDWRAHAQWQAFSGEYRVALRFVACVDRYRKGALDAVLRRSIDDPEMERMLIRSARRHRGCVGEAGRVAPLLLRAAIAEMHLRSAAPAAPWQGQVALGVPVRIGGVWLSRIADCQFAQTPGQVALLWRTVPGSAAEAAIAAAITRATPSCVAAGPVRFSPTASRIALLEAASRARAGGRPPKPD